MTTTTTTAAPAEDYSIVLEIETPENVAVLKGRPYSRVIVRITEVTGFPDRNLFVQEKVMMGTAGDYRHELIGVAGPVDLVDYTSTPDERMRLRTDTVDMYIESHDLYEQLVLSLVTGLKELVNGMRRLDYMQVTQEITIT